MSIQRPKRHKIAFTLKEPMAIRLEHDQMVRLTTVYRDHRGRVEGIELEVDELPEPGRRTYHRYLDVLQREYNTHRFGDEGLSGAWDALSPAEKKAWAEIEES